MADVDFFLRCVSKCYASICEGAFQCVHALLGIPLKVGEDKVAADPNNEPFEDDRLSPTETSSSAKDTLLPSQKLTPENTN